MPLAQWPSCPFALVEMGIKRAEAFCNLNGITIPKVSIVPKAKWPFGHCAYYRPDGIRICLEHCGKPCRDDLSRNWSWPGSTTDREPYGVIAHELGHHCDYLEGKRKWSYGSEHSEEMRKLSGEKPISGYCPNDAEWFAEMFRIFITNPDLLSQLRPRTFRALTLIWTPLPSLGWRATLGANVPERVVKSLINKGARP